MNWTVSEIRRYPVKSLGGEALTSTKLEPGHGIAGDRRYALMPAAGGEPAPGWRPKTQCVVLVRNETMVRLGARYDDGSGRIVISKGASEVARGAVETPADRARLEAMIDAELAADVGTAMKLAAAGSAGMIGDVNEPFVSLINLASVRELGAALGAEVDPVRFRGNLHLEGVPAWAESGWPGRRFAVGDAVVEVVEPIGRCAATEVNPDTTQRDLHIMKGLAKNFGHTRMGAYAIVVSPGAIAPGAAFKEIG